MWECNHLGHRRTKEMGKKFDRFQTERNIAQHGVQTNATCRLCPTVLGKHVAFVCTGLYVTQIIVHCDHLRWQLIAAFNVTLLLKPILTNASTNATPRIGFHLKVVIKIKML